MDARLYELRGSGCETPILTCETSGIFQCSLSALFVLRVYVCKGQVANLGGQAPSFP